MRLYTCMHAGQPDNALQAAYLAVQITLVQAAVVSGLLYWNIETFVGFFTTDAEVTALIKHCIHWVCLYILVDHAMATLQGIFAGCGKQAIGATLMLVGGWVVTLPLAWTLAFHTGLQLSGIYIAITAGYFLVALAFSYFVWVRFDWPALSEHARQTAADHIDAKFETP